VVDDEEAVREVVGRILRRAGYRVLAAGDGASGVELFERNAADLVCVLLDVTMPGIDGEQALAAMRRVRPAAPVVLMSGFSERELGGRYAGRGLAGLLQKPFAPEVLLQLVRRAARPAHS
jgi:two-component system, cell cycle sensor histidine kinase and response regulator CckA